jgi:tetratricopeptide (TPR) repeat protein
MKFHTLALAAVATASLLLTSGGAFAAPDPVKVDPGKHVIKKKIKLHCKKHWAIKTVKRHGKRTKACVRLVAGLLDDQDLYEQGRDLAKEGRYEEALVVLAAIVNQNDPKVLNYTGYSHRKAGRLETGVAFYQKALAINPDFILAREYLGEGYVAAGRIDLAMVQLDEIKNRCGVNCAEYELLQKAISAAN